MNDAAAAARPRVPKSFCTTREAAAILGVSLRTVQMWSNAGMIEAWKTQGGHRRLSRASVERLLAHQPGAREPAAPPASSGEPGFTVLVADDEPDLLRLYRINIERWPQRPRVITAANGYEALVLIGREAPDLLVLDLHMPELDGYRVLQTLAGMTSLDRLAIVVVTGLADADMGAGGNIPAGIPVLPKPIPFERLRAIGDEVAARAVRGRPADSRKRSR